MSTILVVEDEQHLADGLKYNLEAEGFVVDVVEDGEGALERLGPGHGYDAVVLDVMLPGKDGFAIAAELRAAGEYVPVLMLTARGRPEDVLGGFAAGADDYLPKPFVFAILLARLNGLLRRRDWMQRNRDTTPADEPPVIPFNDKVIDFGTLEIRDGERTVHLTAMEADLLRYLIRHEGQVVSRKSLLNELWGVREDTDTRAIDNFIVRLRRYLEEEPSRPRHLLTIRGIGYRFVMQPA